MRILALSPHTDDIELGCGGYLSRMSEEGHPIYILTFSHVYNGRDLFDEHLESLSHLRPAVVCIEDFKPREYDRQGVLDKMIAFKKDYRPDIVFMPSLSDVHQDHKVVADEAVRAFSKDCSLLSYELAWNCRSFTPNYYAKLQRRHLEQKLQMLSAYESQQHRPYFRESFIQGNMEYRGQQVRTELAEAFEVVTQIV